MAVLKSSSKFQVITQHILVMLNILVLAFAIVFLGIGIWIRTNETSIYDALGRGSPFAPSIFMIVAGAILLCIAVLGIVAGIAAKKFVTIAYLVSMTVILIAQVILVSMAAVYEEEITDYVRDKTTESLKKYYGEKDERKLSIGLDKIQEKFECCGVRNYTEWASSKWSTKVPTLRVPSSCCKNPDKEPNCGQKTSSLAGIYTKPCSKDVEDWAKERLVIIAAVGGVEALISLCGIFAAIFLLKSTSKKYRV